MGLGFFILPFSPFFPLSLTRKQPMNHNMGIYHEHGTTPLPLLFFSLLPSKAPNHGVGKIGRSTAKPWFFFFFFPLFSRPATFFAPTSRLFSSSPENQRRGFPFSSFLHFGQVRGLNLFQFQRAHLVFPPLFLFWGASRKRPGMAVIPRPSLPLFFLFSFPFVTHAGT